jgi:hypothetical protein
MGILFAAFEVRGVLNRAVGGHMIEFSGLVQVENPAEALRNQNGTFKVTSPDGHVFQVICRKGSNMRIREIGDAANASSSQRKRWQIEKLAQPIA